VHQPRLADTRVACDCGNAACAIGLDSRERIMQLPHFALPTDERGDGARREAVEARAYDRRASHFGGLDGLVEALDLHRADGACLYMSGGESHCVGGGQHCSCGRHLLHARRDVHGEPDRGVAEVQAVLVHPQHDLPRIEADPDLQRHAMRTLRFLAVVAYEVLHGERGARRPHGMVFGGDRRAEQRHDPVAHDLAHRAAILVDGLAHVLQHRVEQRACFLRIATGDDVHRTLEVGEQHRHELALALDRGGRADNAFHRIGQFRFPRRSGDRVCAFGAELGRARQARAAGDTGKLGPGIGHGRFARGVGPSDFNTAFVAVSTSLPCTAGNALMPHHATLPDVA